MRNERRTCGAWRTPSSRCLLALFAVVATASAAMGQSRDDVPIDPIEETWRYLVELFRMVLGL